jgi:2-keto-myo-inositol isomerase
MKPAISQVCTLDAPWELDVSEYAAGKCQAMEVWLGKLEGYLQRHGLDDVHRVLDTHQMSTPVASFQGGLLLSQADARREHWEHFSRRLTLCHQLGIGTLVLAGDLLGPLSPQDIERVQVSLIDAARRAGDQGVRLAFEFQARATLANNLQTAAALVMETGEPNLGLCFDVFQYYLGPSKFEDLAHLSPDNLFHVQLCDLLGTTRELATDADRILPGDGDFELTPIVDRFRDLGYDGYVSLEMMNPQIWRIPPRQLGEIGMTALRKLLGQARMD